MNKTQFAAYLDKLSVLHECSEQQETEARANNFLSLSTRRSWVSLPEDSLSGHLYARRSRTQDKSSRVACTGI